MVKWGYYTWCNRGEYGDRFELDETTLSEIGIEGWELVSVTTTFLYIFKRPKQESDSYIRGGGGFRG